MLRLCGSRKTLCDGFSRRDLLHIGGLGMFGLGLSDALRLQALASEVTTAPSFGKAKACILLFPFGSPPQHETFDPKPDAPAEIQGELKAIATSVPGVQIGEGLPQVARMMDRMTVVRSMNHPYPLHGVAYALSGIQEYDTTLEVVPRAARQWPFIGSIVDYLDEQRSAGLLPGVPRNIGLPWLFGSKGTVPNLAGPYAAFLGPNYDPVWTDYDGKGSKVVPKLGDSQANDVRDPFGGVEPGGKFKLGADLPADLSIDRLGVRRSLLAQFDAAQQQLAQQQRARSFDKHRATALSLLTSSKMRTALDMTLEPESVRERYGHTLFGQASLVARRLVEAGGRFVTVFWDPFEPFGGSVWDTHANHFPRLKEYLLPVFDQAYSALISDLDERGMLDETLVLCISEHGRTPQIDSKPKGAGRHHWSRVYSAALAGGGVARGKVVGQSDAKGGDVKDTPVSPKDILATAFHLLGIDPNTAIKDPQGRPHRVAGEGQVRTELLG
jgi:hypothetical protein